MSSLDARAPGRSGGGGSDLRQLARGSSFNLAGSFVAAALNLVLPVVITRSLTTTDAGLFFQATAIFTILLNVGTIGADTGVLRALPQATVLDRHRDLPRYLLTAILPAIVFSLGVAGALVLASGPTSRLLTDGSASAEAFQDALIAIAPWVPVAVVYAITMSASRGLGSVKPLVLVEKIGRNLLETVGAGIAAAVTTSIALIVTAWVAPYAAMLIVVGVWVLRRTKRMLANAAERSTAPTPWRPLASEFWRFSAPRALSRVFTVALQRFDILVVAAIRGPADAAVYAAATRFLVLGLMFVQAIQQVMAPKISECLALGEDRRAEAIYRTTTTWLTLVSWPIYLQAMLFAPLLMTIFGPEFERGATAAVILCGAMLVATACGPVDSMLLMAGRSVLSLINTGLALATNVALDLVLVPEFGVSGAAMGWAAGIFVNNLLPLYEVNRFHRMHPLGPSTLTAMAISVVSFGIVAGLVRVVLGPDLVGFLVAGGLGTAVFLVLVGTRFEVLQLAALGAVLRRRQSR